MAPPTEPDGFKAALADPATRDDRFADVLEEIVAERALDLPRGVGRMTVADDGSGLPTAISLDDNAGVRDLMDGIPPG